MKTFQDIINKIAPDVEEWRKEHAERIKTGKTEECDEKKR